MSQKQQIINQDSQSMSSISPTPSNNHKNSFKSKRVSHVSANNSPEVLSHKKDKTKLKKEKKSNFMKLLATTTNSNLA